MTPPSCLLTGGGDKSHNKTFPAVDDKLHQRFWTCSPGYVYCDCSEDTCPGDFEGGGHEPEPGCPRDHCFQDSPPPCLQHEEYVYNVGPPSHVPGPNTQQRQVCNYVITDHDNYRVIPNAAAVMEVTSQETGGHVWDTTGSEADTPLNAPPADLGGKERLVVAQNTAGVIRKIIRTESPSHCHLTNIHTNSIHNTPPGDGSVCTDYRLNSKGRTG